MQHLQKTRGWGYSSHSGTPPLPPTLAAHGWHSPRPAMALLSCLFLLTSLHPCFFTSSLIVTVTEIPSPQLLWIQHSCPERSRAVQTVTPITPLQCTLTKTAGCHSLFLLSFHSLHQERFTTRFYSESSALFLKTAGCHIPASQKFFSLRSLPSVALPSCPPAPPLASLPASGTIAALPSGGEMSFRQRFDEIRTGFERPFWVANITEIFARLSYYGAFASLANYLHEKLNFPTDQTATPPAIFAATPYFLPISPAPPPDP